MRAIAFVLRGCPAAWLGAYGNEWIVTPHLDQLAAEGIVFDRHISDCPDPIAAGEAWLHGPRLLERLQSADVRTVLVRANHPDTDAPASFYAGWGEVFDARPQEEDTSPLDNLLRSLPSMLDRLTIAPRWLLWVEIDRCLPPWDVPQEVFEAYLADDADENPPEVEDEPVTPCADPSVGPFDSSDLAAWQWLQLSFASVITKLDAELGELFERLRTRGLDQTAAWLVTSDRGYPLGEHGQIGVHRPRLHEELVHVPLLLRLPGAAEAGRRVPAFTQPCDLAPSLLSLFGIEPLPGPFPGHCLLPLALGEHDSIRPNARSRLECNGANETAIRTEEWAYLRPTKVNGDDPPRKKLLFAKPDDRWETNSVVDQHDDVVRELEKLLVLE